MSPVRRLAILVVASVSFGMWQRSVWAGMFVWCVVWLYGEFEYANDVPDISTSFGS